MQAAHARVPVVPCLGAVRPHNLVEPLHELRQLLRRYRRILYEWQRLRIPWHIHHQTQPGFPHIPHLRLVGRLDESWHRVSHTLALHARLQPLQFRHQFRLAVRDHLHHQQRLRVALDEVRHPRVRQVAPRLPNDHAAYEFHSSRIHLQRCDGGFHGFDQVVEVNDRQGSQFRLLDQFQLRLSDGDQRAL